MFNQVLRHKLLLVLIVYTCSTVQSKAEKLSVNMEASLRKVISEETVQYLKSLSEKQEYDSAANHKSLAVCLNWGSYSKSPAYTDSWGLSWEYESSQEAEEEAMKSCNKHLKKGIASYRSFDPDYEPECSCRIILSNSNVSIDVPKHIIESRFNRLRKFEIPTLCSNWITAGKLNIPSSLDEPSTYCENYSGFRIALMDFPLIRILESKLDRGDVPDIYPGLPRLQEKNKSAVYVDRQSIRFARPTKLVNAQTELTPPKNWQYRFRLHRIPRNSKTKFNKMLEGLKTSKFFDKIDVSYSEGLPPPAAFHSSIARYIRVFDLSQFSIDKFSNSKWPEDSLKLIDGERSTKLWAVISIPIDENWIPTGAPMIEIEPIALETTSDLYLYSMEMESNFRWRNYGGGNVPRRYEGVFNFSQCNKPKLCSNQIISKLKSELVDAFQLEPISATLSSNPMPPGQIQFRRLYDKSNVLEGFSGPWYEITTYNITIWEAPENNYGYRDPFRVSKSDHYKGSNPLVKIHLHVEMSLQIGIGKHSAYPEPTKEQYARYEFVLDKAINSALKQTNEYFKGKMQNNTGYIKEARKK